MTSDAKRVSLLMGLLFGLAGMGSSSAAVVLPVMAEDLGTSVGVATWTISLYTLMLAITTAVYGRISDLVGVRWPLAVGLALMVLGALGAALAPNLAVLIAARGMQGFGAAAIPTLGVAALSARYDGDVRGNALARLAGAAAAVSCLGPLVGGTVESAFGWRAVMALPVLGLLVLPFIWHALTDEGTGAHLDIPGALLVMAATGGVVLLLQSPASGLLLAGVGVALLALGVPAVVAWVKRHPMGFLPEEVATNRTVVRSALAASAIPASWFALLVGVPAVLVGEGWETWHVGLLLLPSAALALLIPQYVGRVLARVGATKVLVGAAVVSAGAMALAALGTAIESPWLRLPLLVGTVLFTTVAFGVGQPSLSAAVSDAVRAPVRGVALGVATLCFLLGGSIGAAVVGGVGDALGVPVALGLLALLPVLGVIVLLPEIGDERRRSAAEEPRDTSGGAYDAAPVTLD
ncbi:MFS transporter [Nocardioidaceae bacterium]|nr:MFS transporter [Nocardioidaceae bacterium]